MLLVLCFILSLFFSFMICGFMVCATGFMSLCVLIACVVTRCCCICSFVVQLNCGVQTKLQYILFYSNTVFIVSQLPTISQLLSSTVVGSVFSLLHNCASTHTVRAEESFFWDCQIQIDTSQNLDKCFTVVMFILLAKVCCNKNCIDVSYHYNGKCWENMAEVWDF